MKHKKHNFTNTIFNKVIMENGFDRIDGSLIKMIYEDKNITKIKKLFKFRFKIELDELTQENIKIEHRLFFTDCLVENI